MTDSYRMSDMCAMCGELYGQHVGLSCCNSRGSFFLAAEPAAMTDSYHYESVAKFRVGGFYRQKNGQIVGLRDDKHNPEPGMAWAKRTNSDFGEGFRCLTTGVDSIRLKGGLRDLIPGELVQRNGQWVPADSIGPFPSGATLKVAGDKIVGRVEAEPATTFGAILRRVLDRLGAPAPVAEPIRPALDWNTAKPFDTFGADFIVTKGAEPTSPLHTSPTTDSAYPAIAGLLRG